MSGCSGEDPRLGAEDLPVCRGGSRRPEGFGELELPEDVSLDESVLAGMGSGCKGLFISFEGVDGSGKTTQLELLAASLRAAGYEVVSTREPGGTTLGEGVRTTLLDRSNAGISPRTEALLYAAARAQLVEEVIRPALAQGKIVLSDRYIDSSLAYQGYARDLGFENIISLNMWATDCLFPDLTLVLLVDEETRAARLAAGGAPADRLEAEGDGFFREVTRGYERLVADHPHRLRGVDGRGGVEETRALVAAVVAEELELSLES